MTPTRTLQSGAVLAALAVALGAFAAHALTPRLDAAALSTFETGARYQMYAALALLTLGTQATQRRAPAFLLAGALMFSGSLYVLALSGVKVLGAITPIGGLLMITGFLLAALDASRPAH
ncbi:DUF423 domain-containing protein [Deinococcus taeanensis]|uniref:DUF423 domain-containing protein n=1 Tax=Deinococcus taeanensis TaxID=2737050 RepID=UPI001CDC41ED|nr:DUF423 domain-containing protein [Deinococcus taeanensis]UBV43322.1 DUF423 domain-containing protein [Deinococcus taeanensis]